MSKNLSTADRIVRALIFILFLVLYLTGITAGATGVVLLIVGIVLLLTSFISFCPLYRIFGISSCALKQRKTEHKDATATKN